MPDLVLGIGDMGISNDPGVNIKTYALGSCIAVVLYNAEFKTGGMVHIALADSNINEEKSKIKPGYFADTGIPELLTRMRKKMGSLDLSGLEIKLIGGARVIRDERFFDIGGKNIETARKLIRSMGLKIKSEDTAGDISRTVTLFTADGRTMISNVEKGKWFI